MPLHHAKVTKTEEKELEEFWVIHGINQGKGENFAMTGAAIVFGDVGKCISKKELDHEPTKEEIAQFLSDCNADFVSVGHNHRFAGQK